MHEDVRRDFIVVLGPARSGTSLLRDLIGCHPAATAIPFDVNHVWRLGNERHPDDALSPDLATPQVRLRIRRRLLALARRSAGAAHWPEVRLVAEKTVGNALRPHFVDAVLGGPRYVRIVRDPRQTIASTVASWKASPSLRHLVRKLRFFGPGEVGYAGWYVANALAGMIRHRRGVKVWGARYPGIDSDIERLDLESVCARQWLAAIDSMDAFFATLPPERGLSVRYEDIVADPASLERVWAFAGLPDDGLSRRLHAEIVSAAPLHSASLPGGMADGLMAAVYARMAAFGYD
ncbi:sulfotransferase family protein [Tepidamorphus gemmatus]|uniref:Sulfotransferase family protein n=1 Tax=Tepidamorphus gemmatus TaxID=747076 RepID=A0A4R3MG86_9HYPH|nr:sulfotransferase [Tepidamorphus gemmatus]TCT12621.1 sulfotransferase family protein [Tepidamorphus gemmatus]